MLKASEISSSRDVRAASRSMSPSSSPCTVGPAVHAAMSGNPRRDGACPRLRLQRQQSPPRRRGKPRRNREDIILSNATIFSHVAFGSRLDDGSVGFGAHGHAAGHPRTRGDHPEAGGHESSGSRTRGRGFVRAGGGRSPVLRRGYSPRKTHAPDAASGSESAARLVDPSGSKSGASAG